MREEVYGNLTEQITLNSPIQRLRPDLLGSNQVDGNSNVGKRHDPEGVLKTAPRKDIAGRCKTDRQAQHEAMLCRNVKA